MRIAHTYYHHLRPPLLILTEVLVGLNQSFYNLYL